eukprot:Hpha_TRINITY_DN20881_c0_g1::TRINITY_DN20881_c0_g1_i1::g.85641::m.85641
MKAVLKSMVLPLPEHIHGEKMWQGRRGPGDRKTAVEKAAAEQCMTRDQWCAVFPGEGLQSQWSLREIWQVLWDNKKTGNPPKPRRAKVPGLARAVRDEIRRRR